MKKKFLFLSSLIIVAAVAFFCLFGLSQEAKAARMGYYYYSVTDGNATIYDCDTSIIGDVTIPDTLDGYPVTGITGQYIGYSSPLIWSGAFSNCTRLTSITIPDSVTIIDNAAFNNCTGLTNVNFNATNCTTKGPIFSGCDNLSTVNVGDNVTNIPAVAFRNCTGLTSVTIGNSVESIGNYAFADCTKLTSITIPDGVTSINNGAFRNCSSLTSITIPDSVTSIGDSTFSNCTGLLEVWYGCMYPKVDLCIGSDNYNLINATWHYSVCEDVDHQFLLNSDYTCNICGYSKTPNAPIVESKTNSSVTLIPTDGFEYSNDGATWQTGNVFTNLSADTTYTLYQRVKASTIALVSQVSQGTSVTFKSAQVTPAAPIISSFTDTVVTLIPVNGCEYSVDGVNWQDGNVFTDLSPATQYTFYQRKAETVTYEASDASSTGITTDKSKQLLVPVAPTVQSFTSDSITLTPEDGCEYSIDGITWKSSNVFGGLSCGTEYTFYQRYKQTATTYAGKSSEALVAKTDKGTQSKPSVPTLSGKTYNSVTLQAISGYEYSRDGINWQSSNVFTDLAAETNYMFYQRKAETDAHYASEASAHLVVKTEEAPACVADPSQHSYTNACDSTCNVCGTTRIVAHNYADATCDAPKTCKVCRETEGAPLSHDYSDASCIAPSTCSRCGDTRGSALGHDMGQWETTKAATCVEEGSKRKTCSCCDYFETEVIPATVHSYNAVVTEPTCMEQGYTTHTCHCGDSYVDSYVDALGHKWGGWETTKAATCTANGTQSRTCSTCKKVETKAVIKTGHSYDAGKITKAPTCKSTGVMTYTCRSCNGIKTVTIAKLTKHTYDNSCDTTCNVCSAKRSITHSYDAGKVTKAATCKAAGVKTYTCSICKATKTATIAKLTTHTYKTTTTKATLSKDGKIVKKCTVCGKVASTKVIKRVKTVKLSATSYVYNGKAKAPTVTVKDSAGKTLKKGTDYTVTYASGRKNVGTYKVTIKFKGNYTGTKVLTFNIVPKAASINKLTAKSKAITVKLNRVTTQSTGYEIQYSTSSKFTSAKTVNVASYKTSSKTISGLKKGNKYYVRVRTYKTVGKIKLYSAWSAAKSVKTK